MNTCPSCGGVIGRDCFNPTECAEITYQQEMVTQQQMTANIDQLYALVEALEARVKALEEKQ